MNVLRRFLPCLLLGGSCAAALATGSATAQAQVIFREPARLDASTLKPASTVSKKPKFDWSADDSNAELPRVKTESRKASAHLPVGSGVRPASVGFVPKHQKVVGAQFLSEEPMTETLPGPLDPSGAAAPPSGMGPPAGGSNSILRNNNNGRSVPKSTGPIITGEGLSGEVPFGGDVFDAGSHGGCAGGNCEGGDCGPCGQVIDCYPCLDPRNLEVWTGVFGFTNPTNRGGSGSFGYSAGLNKGRPLLCFPCSNIGMQFGIAGQFANFDGGTFANGPALANTPDTRNQLFLTGGVFRRADCGLQGGIVFDYLHDEWYSAADLGQLRGEASWVYPYNHEVGFWFSGSVNGSSQTGRIFVGGRPVIVNEVWEATDMYAFFYRRRFEEYGGEGRLFGGFTGDGDGLFGSDFFVPLTDNWGIQGGYTYLLPKDENRLVGSADEAWNVAINFVWAPGRGRNCGQSDYNRPLLGVANNGNFIVKRRLLP
jgi:hypothetical protein